MKDNLIDIHRYEDYTRSYDTKYIAEVTHTGLNEFRVFSSTNEYILESKVDSFVAKLEERWEKLVNKNNSIKSKEASLQEAESRTREAINILNQVDNILKYTLSIDDKVDWEQLKDKSVFSKPNPANDLKKLLSIIKGVRQIADFRNFG